MKWLIIRISLLVLGALTFASVLVFEIDGLMGFLLATLGVVLIGIGLTLQGVVQLIAKLIL